jgi:hypothetical protein
MKTQKFTMEITDKTGQFPIDPKKLESIMNKALPDSHVCSIYFAEVKE